MKPDDLGRALLLIIQDIFGAQGQFRSTPITREEWGQLDQRWVTLLAMNRPKEDRRGVKSGNRTEAARD